MNQKGSQSQLGDWQRSYQLLVLQVEQIFNGLCINIVILEGEAPLEWYELTENLHHVFVCTAHRMFGADRSSHV
jgi:hypothetical protein